MTQQLEPCPLCGNEVRSFMGLDESDDVRYMEVECDCGLDFHAESRIYAWNHHDEAAEIAELEAKWNTRAERTCHMGVPDIREGLVHIWPCGECGLRTVTLFDPPAYCEWCGAKAVG